MLLNQNDDAHDHSFCRLTYDEAEGWLQADWVGYVDPLEAQRGAEAFLRYAGRQPSPYLLNNNEALRGPWFDSLDWLARTWLPLARPLGLRYVAHIAQADGRADVLSRHLLAPLPFELQIFHHPGDARHWLRQQRDAAVRRPPGQVAPAASGAAAGGGRWPS